MKESPKAELHDESYSYSYYTILVAQVAAQSEKSSLNSSKQFTLQSMPPPEGYFKFTTMQPAEQQLNDIVD